MMIFSFGASTAQGARDTEGGGFIGRLAKRLAERHRIRVENCGVGGHTTEQMLPRLADLPIASQEDIAIVTLGINDVPRTPDPAPQKRVPLDRHKSNVQRLLADLAGRCRVLYLTQYPVDFTGRGLERQVVESYVEAGRQAAGEAGVEILDINLEIDQEKYRVFIDDDGMHFNASGHAYIEGRIWQRLEPWLE